MFCPSCRRRCERRVSRDLLPTPSLAGAVEEPATTCRARSAGRAWGVAPTGQAQPRSPPPSFLLSGANVVTLKLFGSSSLSNWELFVDCRRLFPSNAAEPPRQRHSQGADLSEPRFPFCPTAFPAVTLFYESMIRKSGERHRHVLNVARSATTLSRCSLTIFYRHIPCLEGIKDQLEKLTIKRCSENQLICVSTVTVECVRVAMFTLTFAGEELRAGPASRAFRRAPCKFPDKLSLYLSRNEQ